MFGLSKMGIWGLVFGLISITLVVLATLPRYYKLRKSNNQNWPQLPYRQIGWISAVVILIVLVVVYWPKAKAYDQTQIPTSALPPSAIKEMWVKEPPVTSWLECVWVSLPPGAKFVGFNANSVMKFRTAEEIAQPYEYSPSKPDKDLVLRKDARDFQFWPQEGKDVK